MLRFRFKGQLYEFDYRFSVVEARLIKKYTRGMGVGDIVEGLAHGDPDSYVAMLYIVKARAGEAPRWADFDDVMLPDDVEPVEDDEPASGDADGPAGEGVDPTQPGSTPTSGSTST